MTLRLIRKKSSSSTDDTIHVKHIGTNQFSLVYTYGDSEPATVRTTALPRGSLIHYLETTFSLLQLDEDPFEFVQLDFSFIPSVLIAIKNLKAPAILNAISLQLDQATGEEDEYADMPPLIPISAADRYFSPRHEIYEEED